VFDVEREDALAEDEIKSRSHEKQVSLKRLALLDRFATYKTDLTQAHGPKIVMAARQIVNASVTPFPIRLVHVIGHAQTWGTISDDTYRRRAATRALNAAKALAGKLRSEGLEVTIRPELKPAGRRTIPKCELDRKADVTLCVGERGDDKPKVVIPGIANSGSALARDARARNRRVEIFYYDKIRPKGRKADIDPPVRPKPKPTPAPASRRLPMCIQYCPPGSLADVRAIAFRSLRAIRMAKKRMDALERMPENRREKAWDSGREREWFGRYRRSGRRVPFEFVKQTVDRMSDILHGAGKAGNDACVDRLNHLTIECFPPPRTRPSRLECGNLAMIEDPRTTWGRASGMARFQAENHYLENRILACTNPVDSSEFGYSITVQNAFRPLDRKREPKPYKIALSHGFFQKPSRMSTQEWREGRRVTILHEVAHLSGANRSKLLGEVGGRKRALRLAKRNAWGARVNAENYAFYVTDTLR
jgi:hypothetical protein